MRPLALLFAPALFFSAASAEEAFTLREDGAVLHGGSGFVCPAKIGMFERDAFGSREEGDYCAYSALTGLYGTIIVKHRPALYDPPALLAPEFRKVESMGGRAVAETVQPVGPDGAAVPVFLRTYDMAKLDMLTYRTQLASAALGGWAVEAVVEYAYPRDKEDQTAFVTAVYGEAIRDMGAPN
ncbi:hypothetical protein GCM10008941_35230 [Rhizomicrobium palustre]